MNIYRVYNFDFNKEMYLKEFKRVLNNSNILKPAQFNKLLRNAGVKEYDIETVKSYFYGRRVPPLKVLIAVSKSLRVSADSIVFPQSVQSFNYDGDISDCDVYFRNIFMPYNISKEDETVQDLDLLFSAESYESIVDRLALIIAKYNYIIQKYHHVGVSKDELAQISSFTSRYIIDKENGNRVLWDDINKWIKSFKDKEFLIAFYDKYELGFYSKSCRSLVEKLNTLIPNKFVEYAKQLLF